MYFVHSDLHRLGVEKPLAECRDIMGVAAGTSAAHVAAAQIHGSQETGKRPTLPAIASDHRNLAAMAPGQPLALERGQPRTLAYTAGIRHDLRLLEVADEAMLQELLAGG